MSALNDLGYRLVASAPNDAGLCTFAIVDSEGAEVATLDAPCTLDEAMSAARRFAESEIQENE